MTNKHERILLKQPSVLERVLFSQRWWVVVIFSLLTLALGYQAAQLKPDASFSKMIPQQHPFIVNMMDNYEELKGSGNYLQIAVEAKQGDIFDADYLESLKLVTEEVFYLSGVDRKGLKSLWTPNVRWLAVTAEGFDGGPVIPDNYDGSPDTIEQLRTNIMRSGEVGRLVANNYRSAIIYVPLFDQDPRNGAPLDYQQLTHELEEKVRGQFNSDKIDIHIVGFAKKVGDLLDGITSIGLFAAITLLITALLLFYYARCLRSTLAPLVCSMVAVVWLLGMLTTAGYGLNAYSVLVPFLVFAIGVSHGVQIINGINQIQLTLNKDKVMSARLAFRQLYVAGMIALVSDAMGFLTLLLIDIEVIQELAIAASLGVMAIIFTNLLLLPVIMSFVGVGNAATERARLKQERQSLLWTALSHVVRPRIARGLMIAMVVLFGVGLYLGQNLRIGDLDKGAPELHPDSRYNLDNAFIVDNFSSSSDVLVILAKTAVDQCATYPVLDTQQRLEWHLQKVPGVQSTLSLAGVAKKIIMGMNEGSIKLYALSRDRAVLNTAISDGIPASLMNEKCSMVPVIVFLDDHKAETLKRVVSASQRFIDDNPLPGLQLLMGAGNAAIEAATNEVIEDSQTNMLLFVYLVVSLLVLATFRTLSSVICIILPLALTTVLCQALMGYLGIGVKVATLPVMALGVGVGVDYGIYIYSRLHELLKQGLCLEQAFHQTLQSTGKAVSFTGVTLAIGVASWMWSPIKFQADMGILLTFMFLLNMLGALCLLPALAHYLIRDKKPVVQETGLQENKEQESEQQMSVRGVLNPVDAPRL